MSGSVPEPPSAQSPFARLGCYLWRRDVSHLVGRRYPPFFAPTDSCVRPSSSRRFRSPLFGQSLQVAVSPCWKIGPSRRYLHNLCKGAWTRTPPRSYRSIRLCASAWGFGASIAGHRPFPRVNGIGTRKYPCNATATGRCFRGCSHSLMFRLPCSLGPPVAPTAVPWHRAAGPFTTRNEHVVTRPDLSEFYMNRVIAT